MGLGRSDQDTDGILDDGLEGSEEFLGLAKSFAGMSPLEQQKELLKSSRDYQKYAQWSSYLQGGNAEAYALFNQLVDVNAGQTQAIQSIFSQAQMNGANLTPGLPVNLGQQVYIASLAYPGYYLQQTPNSSLVTIGTTPTLWNLEPEGGA